MRVVVASAYLQCQAAFAASHAPQLLLCWITFEEAQQNITTQTIANASTELQCGPQDVMVTLSPDDIIDFFGSLESAVSANICSDFFAKRAVLRQYLIDVRQAMPWLLFMVRFRTATSRTRPRFSSPRTCRPSPGQRKQQTATSTTQPVNRRTCPNLCEVIDQAAVFVCTVVKERILSYARSFETFIHSVADLNSDQGDVPDVGRIDAGERAPGDGPRHRVARIIARDLAPTTEFVRCSFPLIVVCQVCAGLAKAAQKANAITSSQLGGAEHQEFPRRTPRSSILT